MERKCKLLYYIGVYLGIIGYILGLYRDNGKENGSYYKTRLILNILHSYLP